MSGWDAYSEGMSQRKVEECGIYSCNGDRWTEKCQKGCSPDEVRKVATAIEEDDENMKTNGACFFGQPWTYIRTLDDRTVLFRGKGEQKKKSLVLSKSDRALVAVCCSEDTLPTPAAVTEAASMRDYLKHCGF